jgi:hypothetical protein
MTDGIVADAARLPARLRACDRDRDDRWPECPEDLMDEAADSIEALLERVSTLSAEAGRASLQRRVTAWHEVRFPLAQVTNVALKLAEECGEVASAVNAAVGVNSATGKGDVPSELADVVIAA